MLFVSYMYLKAFFSNFKLNYRNIDPAVVTELSTKLIYNVTILLKIISSSSSEEKMRGIVFFSIKFQAKFY